MSCPVVKKDTAAHLLVYIVKDDHITPHTGLVGGDFTVHQISKGAGAFGSWTVTITERGYGWYDVTLAAGDTDTLGAGALHCEAPGIDPVDEKFFVELATSGDLSDLVAALDNSLVARRGTCQAGSIASTIVLDAGAAGTNNYYKGMTVNIVGGTGAGQTNDINSYVAASKTATVPIAWTTIPDATSQFEILRATSTLYGQSIGSLIYGVVNGRLPAALDGSGFMKAQIKGMDADTVTAAAIATDAITANALDATAATEIASAVLDAARSGHVTLGSIGEAIALSAALLQGNFYMDQVDNSDPNGQTSARIRVFHNGAAAAAATSGGSGEGEFATFVVATTYEGVGKVTDHRVVQQ